MEATTFCIGHALAHLRYVELLMLSKHNLKQLRTTFDYIYVNNQRIWDLD